MKKLLAITLVLASCMAFADIMQPIVPKNTLQIYLERAKAYTDSKLGESSTATEGKLDEIKEQLNDLASRVRFLEATTQPKEGTTGIDSEPGQVINVNDAETEAYVRGTVDKPATLLAKSVTLDNVNVAPDAIAANGNGVTVTSPTVDVMSSTMTGVTQTSSNLMKVMGADTMTVKDTTFTGPTYNTLMTGQNTTEYLKELTIENCVFDEDCKHVNIWFAGFKDNATLTIKNCRFKTCEQFLCISDFSGTTNRLNVVLDNVVIENYEKDADDKYSGFMLFDDRFCQSEEEFLAAAPFAGTKLTITMNNVTAGGVKVTPENFKMGTDNGEQMAYMYCAKARKTYLYTQDTAALFPTIIIDTVIVNN